MIVTKRQKKDWALAVALAVCLAGCSQVAWSYFYSPDHGFRIKYPRSWEKRERIMESIVTFAAPAESPEDPFRENVSLTVQDISGRDLTLQQYSRSMIEHMRAILPVMNMIESSSARMGSYPAHRIVYEFRERNVTMRFYQIWTIRGDQVYIFAYTAIVQSYDQYLPIIKDMIKSFEFI